MVLLPIVALCIANFTKEMSIEVVLDPEPFAIPGLLPIFKILTEPLLLLCTLFLVLVGMHRHQQPEFILFLIGVNAKHQKG
jgi:hypothetical protein